MDGIVHGVAKSQTWLSNLHVTFHMGLLQSCDSINCDSWLSILWMSIRLWSLHWISQLEVHRAANWQGKMDVKCGRTRTCWNPSAHAGACEDRPKPSSVLFTCDVDSITAVSDYCWCSGCKQQKCILLQPWRLEVQKQSYRVSNRGLDRAGSFWIFPGRICVLPLSASGGCQHSLPGDCVTPLSASAVTWPSLLFPISLSLSLLRILMIISGCSPSLWITFPFHDFLINESMNWLYQVSVVACGI